jgi:hypothetical protein
LFYWVSGVWGRRLARCHGPGRRSSPMFTDLSALFALNRRRQRKSLRFRPCRQPPRPTPSGNASACSSSARQLNRMARWLAHGAQGRPNRPEDTVKSGLQLPSAAVESADPVFQGSQRLRCPQHITASDRPFRTGILTPAIPERTMRSSLRQLAVSPNSRAEPKNVLSAVIVHLLTASLAKQSFLQGILPEVRVRCSPTPFLVAPPL